MRHGLLFFFFCFALLLNAQPRLWDMGELEQMRQDAEHAERRYILKQAEAAVGSQPVAVTDKALARSGDKHNFESLSPYWWPDPENPGGPYKVKDGQFNPECKAYDLPRMSALNQRTHYLAKAYYITRDERYRKAFMQQIDVWFLDRQTRMNPHFEYAQFIPGRNDGRGAAAGMIDAYNFIDVLESVRLVESVRPMGRKRWRQLQAWFGDFAVWMQQSAMGQTAQNFDHNIGTAYDILLCYLSDFTGDAATARRVAENFEEKRINAQIEADGTQPIQLRRTKVFSYSVSNLQHIMDMCVLQKKVPSRVRKALEHLSQYIGKAESFPHQEIGDWQQAERKLIANIRRANQLGCDIRY